MSTNNKCPCYQCICVPMCRHKSSISLFDECSLLIEYEPNWNFSGDRSDSRMYEIQSILDPTTWRYRRIKGSDNPRMIRILQEPI